jgi:2-polyprenyl-3-methyl-5-hydroxy-6-metoxy-1,4-benzoquinol methylase
MHFSKAGHRVTGYDYSPNLTKAGRAYGLDLRQGTIKDIEGKYDLIILNHVMEHFTDLFGSMKTLTNHLKPGGFMYIGVPNIDNYDLGQLQNAHVYYFTPRTFKFFMSRCGLRAIKMGAAEEIHMYGIFQLDHKDFNDFTLESEPKRIMKIIRRAQVKKSIGNILEKIGIKNFIKSALRKFSPRR